MNLWLHIPKAVCHFIIGLHGCNRGINYGQNMGKGMREGRAVEICLYCAQAVGITGHFSLLQGRRASLEIVRVGSTGKRWTFEKYCVEVLLYPHCKIRLRIGSAATDVQLVPYLVVNE
jgi:hypothetical protein